MCLAEPIAATSGGVQEPKKGRKLALVTGASSGIGRALAVLHASKGDGDLIVTARREDALKTLKADLERQHQGIRVEIVLADLSRSDGAQSVYDQVKKLGLEVDYLINNAGFGGHGSILDRSLQEDLSMIQVNVSSVVTLTHLFSADMVAGGKGGKILNVGSIAGFMPGPYQAVYFASKAFLSSFSQAVDQELREKGVTCTVLAPGVTDTEFFAVANLEGAKMTKEPAMSAETVAEIGYSAMMEGRLVATCDYKATLLSWLTALLPRRLLLQIGEDIHRKEARTV
jgi:hypothetical protein